MARSLCFLGAFVVLASCAKEDANSATGAEAKAIAVAREWVQAQGYYESDEAIYEANPRTGTDEWDVLIRYLPPTVGAHTLLILDNEFAVREVIPGA